MPFVDIKWSSILNLTFFSLKSSNGIYKVVYIRWWLQIKTLKIFNAMKSKGTLYNVWSTGYLNLQAKKHEMISDLNVCAIIKRAEKKHFLNKISKYQISSFFLFWTEFVLQIS